MKAVAVVPKTVQAPGLAYCPLCTHTVEVNLTYQGRRVLVTPGQKCPRCSSSIDAGYVIRQNQAA